MKAIEHRPARIAFQLCGLSVLEHVDKTGACSKHEEGDQEYCETCGQPRWNQRHTENDGERTDPHPASSTERDTRRPCANNRADCAYEQCETDLPIGQVKMVLEGWQPQDPAAAHNAEREKGY
jgi:hypothetical protein